MSPVKVCFTGASTESVALAVVDLPEVCAGADWRPALAEALAVLDAHRMVYIGLRRCRGRVRQLTANGAISGGEEEADRRLDRALVDRSLLGAMRGDLAKSLVRLHDRVSTGDLVEMLAMVPLAELQREVFAGRLRGMSWPRIAATWTRGDRGTAVRAYRQAVARARATASVLEATRQSPEAEGHLLAQMTGLSVRTVNLIRRHLASLGAPPPSPVRGAAVRPRRMTPVGRRNVNKPNPDALAEPCPLGGSGEGARTAGWRILQVRAGAGLAVKVQLERALGDRVRCRTIGADRTAVGSYLAVRCADDAALGVALRGLAGVVGWVGAEPRNGQPPIAPAQARADDGQRVAEWLNPRREGTS